MLQTGSGARKLNIVQQSGSCTAREAFTAAAHAKRAAQSVGRVLYSESTVECVRMGRFI